MLVVVTLVPALVLAAFLVRRVARDNREAIDRTLLEAARVEAAVIDAEIDGTIRALTALSLSPRLARGDLAAFRDEAIAFQQTQPTWYRVILVAPDGRQAMNTAYGLDDTLPPIADRDSLARVFSTAAPVVGNLRQGNGRERQLAFTVRVPVRRDGMVTHALTAAILPSALVQIIQRQVPAPGEWSRGVLDGDGTLIARSPDPETFIGRQATPEMMRRRLQREGVFPSVALDGERVLTAFSTAQISGWNALVAVSASSVNAVGNRSLVILAGAAASLLLIGGGFAFVIARRIANDIESAAVAADELASGYEPEVPRSRVSEVRRLSVALRRSASMLEARERERDEHIAQANHAREIAEGANRAKDEFLATLGHELRNPLAPALTALHLMRLRGDTQGMREREIIERQVQHLARLVDDLLDVSRARAGRLEIRRHPFEIVHAIATAVELASPLITARRHKLTIDVPSTGLLVNGDETRLAQVFGNILNNAAKHSDRPGHILVQGRVDGGDVVIACADTGIGIDDELLPRVFDHFSQGPQSIERSQGGLGLGLAVVKTLVELHGGSVSAASGGPGRGSTLTVRLPLLAGAAAARPAPQALTPIGATTRHVLVVDDNHDAAEMLGDMVRLRGHAVTVAFDGLTALRLNEEFRADVAVLDIGLPTMDGLELARRLRKQSGDRGIRLVAMTGYGQASDIEASEAAGFDVHLVKPVVAATLFEALGE